QCPELVLGDGQRRREIDDGAERPDKNAFRNKALPQGVEVVYTIQFDHADGAFDPHVLDAWELATRFETRSQRARDFGDLVEPRLALEQIERRISGGTGERIGHK